MILKRKSQVFLAGAGPGDTDLITIKALKAVRDADVILYDALVNEELLGETKSSCICVFVGKRNHHHTFSQDHINQLLLFYATRHNKVLRLKGGDPFVFGRGSEESEYLEKHGIAVEIIPGISSAIAAPSAVGIPVTKRGVSESFWVITGTTLKGKISEDIKLAAQSSATVVILMGLSMLKEIVSQFERHRAASEPVALVQHATLKNQRAIRGTLSSICELAELHQIGSPAVIIIGKVVGSAAISEIIQAETLKMKVAV